jgi:5'-nucleotidase
VNRGNNAGENAVYSGTVGGAMEAAMHGIRAIALSQFYGPGNSALADPFEAALAHGAGTIRALLDQGLWDGGEYRLFYNVNFPALRAAEVRGLRIVRQGLRSYAQFGIEAQTSPSGRRFLWVTGGPQAIRTGPGTDVEANLDGYVAVTPMRADLTSHDALGLLAARLDSDRLPPS